MEIKIIEHKTINETIQLYVNIINEKNQRNCLIKIGEKTKKRLEYIQGLRELLDA